MLFTLCVKAAEVMRTPGLKKGFSMTLKYTSYTSLKNCLVVSSLLPSCSNKNLTWAAVMKAETCSSSSKL